MQFRQRLSFWHSWQGGAVAVVISVVLFLLAPYIPLTPVNTQVQGALLQLHQQRQALYNKANVLVHGADLVYWRAQAQTLQEQLAQRDATIAQLTTDSALMQMLASNATYKPVALGRLVVLAAPDAVSFITLNAPVPAQAAVMTNTGLLGRVIKTQGNMAQVLPLSHPSSAIPVTNQSGKMRGLLLGRGYAPALLQFAANQTLNEGDILLTSGDGGILPAGLPVGRVRAGGTTDTVLVDLLAYAAPNSVVGVYAPVIPATFAATPADISAP